MSPFRLLIIFIIIGPTASKAVIPTDRLVGLVFNHTIELENAKKAIKEHSLLQGGPDLAVNDYLSRFLGAYNKRLRRLGDEHLSLSSLPGQTLVFFISHYLVAEASSQGAFIAPASFDLRKQLMDVFLSFQFSVEEINRPWMERLLAYVFKGTKSDEKTREWIASLTERISSYEERTQLVLLRIINIFIAETDFSQGHQDPYLIRSKTAVLMQRWQTVFPIVFAMMKIQWGDSNSNAFSGTLRVIVGSMVLKNARNELYKQKLMHIAMTRPTGYSQVFNKLATIEEHLPLRFTTESHILQGMELMKELCDLIETVNWSIALLEHQKDETSQHLKNDLILEEKKAKLAFLNQKLSVYVFFLYQELQRLLQKSKRLLNSVNDTFWSRFPDLHLPQLKSKRDIKQLLPKVDLSDKTFLRFLVAGDQQAPAILANSRYRRVNQFLDTPISIPKSFTVLPIAPRLTNTSPYPHPLTKSCIHSFLIDGQN